MSAYLSKSSSTLFSKWIYSTASIRTSNGVFNSGCRISIILAYWNCFVLVLVILVWCIAFCYKVHSHQQNFYMTLFSFDFSNCLYFAGEAFFFKDDQMYFSQTSFSIWSYSCLKRILKLFYFIYYFRYFQDLICRKLVFSQVSNNFWIWFDYVFTNVSCPTD